MSFWRVQTINFTIKIKWFIFVYWMINKLLLYLFTFIFFLFQWSHQVESPFKLFGTSDVVQHNELRTNVKVCIDVLLFWSVLVIIFFFQLFASKKHWFSFFCHKKLIKLFVLFKFLRLFSLKFFYTNESIIIIFVINVTFWLL